MKYPTIEEVEKASHHDICKFWRFLSGPGVDAINRGLRGEEAEAEREKEAAVMDRIAFRLKEFGGFTPEISKSLGWKG